MEHKNYNISFEEITKENYLKYINLKVSQTQEKFVASNVFSFAQALFYGAALYSSCSQVLRSRSGIVARSGPLYFAQYSSSPATVALEVQGVQGAQGIQVKKSKLT